MFMTYNATKESKFYSGSRKRTFYLITSNVVITASYWDSGSKRNYEVRNILTEEIKTPPTGSYPMFKAEYELQPNEVIICTGFSLGQPSTPSFYCREEDLEQVKKWLGVE